MAAIGVVLHHGRPQAAKLAREAIDWLLERDHTVRVLAEDAEVTSLEQWATDEERFAGGLDLVLSVGGDGTMLRTSELVCGHDVPILGINVGHLGYLSEVEPPEMLTALERFLTGAYSIEERMTLQIRVQRQGSTHDHVALNDAVVEKTAPGHTVRLAVTVNEEFFTTYAADGLIVATPTGSTAYNMSARGPIVSPRHRALLITPVAPHMLFDRTMVRDPSDVIRLDVEGRAAQLSIDGRSHGELDDGDAIICTAGAHEARLVRFGERDFLGIVKHKFGLADR